MRLVITVQWRAKFPHVYFGLTIFAVFVFRTLIPSDLVGLALPAFLFGEPGSLGIFMVAAQRYLEKGEQTVVALAVTPLRSGEYVTALIAGSAIVPTVATTLIQAGVQGFDQRVLLVVPPLFLIAVISGSIGLMLSTVFQDFTRFIIGSIPPIAVYSLPFLPFFGLAPAWPFKWIPSDAALMVFGMLSRNELDVATYFGSVMLLTLFAAFAWWAALATYAARVQRQIEFA